MVDIKIESIINGLTYMCSRCTRKCGRCKWSRIAKKEISELVFKAKLKVIENVAENQKKEEDK